MKVGDLVKCNWQPATSHIEDDCAVPMKFVIKGEIGIVIDKRRHTSFDGMENYLTYNVLVGGTSVWFQDFEIEIFED